MVDIKLDSRYSISADPRQWILMQDERPFWFFPNLRDLLNDYVLLCVKEGDSKNVEELKEALKNTTQSVSHSLNIYQKTLSKAKLPLVTKGRIL